jgi:hypothetical protein
MNCFVCGRNEGEVLLLAVPCEVVYKDHCFEVLGNLIDNEYICLPCVGFQWDDIAWKFY